MGTGAIEEPNGEASSGYEALSNGQIYSVGELVKGGTVGSKESGNDIIPRSTKKLEETGEQHTVEAHISMNLKQNVEASIVHEALLNEAYDDGELVKSGITGSTGGRNKFLHPPFNKTENGKQMVGIGEISDSEIDSRKGV